MQPILPKRGLVINSDGYQPRYPLLADDDMY
jgi:hypothetical protein